MESGPKEGAAGSPHAGSDGESPARAESSAVLSDLERENANLRAEVLRLLRIEVNLSRDNVVLERQASAYRQLSELGKRCNRGLTRDEIAAALVHFALYTANLERCAVQLHDGERLRTVAVDGYYDPSDEQAVLAFSLAPDDPLLKELQQSSEPRLRSLPGAKTDTAVCDRSTDPIAAQFRLDEYVLLPLRDETTGQFLGFLVAGNSRKRAAHHSRIAAGEPLLLSLLSLVELAAVTLRSAALRQTLQAERSQLEARIAERTHELAELNERLRIELKDHQHSEKERAALWESVVRSQAARIAELSTPILPITDQILVLPLIGVLDPTRIEQLGTAVLEGAVQRRARVVILDLTGVQSPDRGLALALGKTARALGLIGVRTLISGIRSELARILVSDGAPLESLTTSSTLQAGIAQAMRLMTELAPTSSARSEARVTSAPGSATRRS